MSDEEIDAQLHDDPALSDRAIAQLVGVDRQRVRRRRRALEDAGSIRAVRVVRGLDGERHRVRRSPKQRKQREDRFTPAQLQWLTGIPEPNANEFETIELEGLHEPHHFDDADSLVSRGELAGLIESSRAQELRDGIEARRQRHRERAPLHPHWVEQQRQQRRPRKQTVVRMRA